MTIFTPVSSIFIMFAARLYQLLLLLLLLLLFAIISISHYLLLFYYYFRPFFFILTRYKAFETVSNMKLLKFQILKRKGLYKS